jgi:hypothetical protein
MAEEEGAVSRMNAETHELEASRLTLELSREHEGRRAVEELVAQYREEIETLNEVRVVEISPNPCICPKSPLLLVRLYGLQLKILPKPHRKLTC